MIMAMMMIIMIMPEQLSRSNRLTLPIIFLSSTQTRFLDEKFEEEVKASLAEQQHVASSRNLLVAKLDQIKLYSTQLLHECLNV